jgi:hypothetical protein
MKVKMEMVMNDLSKSLHFATGFLFSLCSSPPPPPDFFALIYRVY